MVSRAAGLRVVVNQMDQIFLPIKQFELLADELALGDEANRLDELDDVGRGDLIVTQLFLLAPGQAIVSSAAPS